VDVRARLARARSRFNPGVLGRIAQAAAAGGIAWEVALQIPNHGQPFFAPMAAVIALGADRGRRGRQAILMMVGVGVGILIGAAIVSAAGAGAWQLVVGTLVALLVTTAAGAPAIIRTQAATSAILIVALHLVDALIGGGIAIVMARFLFPIDPLVLVRDEARELRQRLAAALDATADALEAGDRSAAREAMRSLEAIDEHRLQDALVLAREVARSAPRRRPLRERLEALGASWLELDGSVHDAHAIGTGALRMLDGGRPSATAAAAVRAAAAAVRAIEPNDAREQATSAKEEASRLERADDSLGAGVIAHGVAAVAEHALRAAAAREEDRRLAHAAGRNPLSRLNVAHASGDERDDDRRRPRLHP
jgi:hypothetical protein